MDLLFQDPLPDRLSGGETDARAKAPSDDQHQHSTERPCDRTADAEVVEQHWCDCRPQHDADEQSDVLREREPEASAEPVGDADDGGSDDDEVDQVRANAINLRMGHYAYPFLVVHL